MMGIKKAFDLFNDSWKLYRKYILKDLKEDDFDNYIEELDQILQKYEHDPFAKDLLIVAVTKEIERKEKAAKNKQKNDQ